MASTVPGDVHTWDGERGGLELAGSSKREPFLYCSVPGRTWRCGHRCPELGEGSRATGRRPPANRRNPEAQKPRPISSAKLDEHARALTLVLKLQEHTPNAGGKTLVVATTHGNVPAGVKVNGQDVIVGLNAYIRK
mgnify:CR=1 FL=1